MKQAGILTGPGIRYRKQEPGASNGSVPGRRKTVPLIIGLLALLVLGSIMPAHADTPFNGLKDGGGAKGSFGLEVNNGVGPFLFGDCFLANQTLAPSTVSFTLGNNTLVGGAVVLSGTLQAELGIIPYTAGGTCSSQPNAFIPSNTLRIQDVIKNAFTSITFTFPPNYIIQNGGGVFVGIEISYTSAPGVNKFVEMESNSANGQFDASQSNCGLSVGTVSGNSCVGGAASQCNSFESCGLYLLNGVPVQAPNVGPTVSPYGSNPASYPCCNPVTQQALYGSYLRAPDVDPLPLELLFVILFALTLGSYLVIRTYRKVQSRQYELQIAFGGP